MTNDERIAKINELAGEDLKFDLDQLRTKELNIVLKGLKYDADVADLKKLNEGMANDLSEVNAKLAEAESTPRDKKAPVVVGKVGDDKIEMTVPQARVNIKGFEPGIYTRQMVKENPELLAALVKMGAGYLRRQ